MIKTNGLKATACVVVLMMTMMTVNIYPAEASLTAIGAGTAVSVSKLFIYITKTIYKHKGTIITMGAFQLYEYVVGGNDTQKKR